MISLMRQAGKRQAVISRCLSESVPLIKNILTDIVGNLFFCLCLARSGYKINYLLMEWMVCGRKLPLHLPASGLKPRIHFSARHGGKHTFNYSIWETDRWISELEATLELTQVSSRTAREAYTEEPCLENKFRNRTKQKKKKKELILFNGQRGRAAWITWGTLRSNDF